MHQLSSPKTINRREALKVFSAQAVSAVTLQLREQQNPASMLPSVAAEFVRTIPPPPVPPLDILALNKMAFGASPSARLEFLALGSTDESRLQAYINQQLSPESIDDSACQAILNAAGFQTLNKSLEQLWADHVVANVDWSYRMLPMAETEKATFLRAVYSKRQLLEILVDFWHNHFNVYGWHGYIGPVMVHYDRDVIRAHALGNFREMVESVAKSTAMLYYLDNYINQAGGFNENFARELLELHTLGAENYLGTGDPFAVPVDENGIRIGYVDNDVYEAARCFTGWRVDYSSWEPGVGETGTFLYYSPWHDRANKFFMGEYFPADQPDLKDGLDVLDMICSHPGTARFVSRKLIRRLIQDDPPASLVEQAAQVFQDQRFAPDQLKQVVRVILESDAFKSTWGEKVKRPFEAAVGMFRITQAAFSPSDDFLWVSDGMGQPLFSKTSPNGYPDEKFDWIGNSSFLQRWKLANYLIEGWMDNISVDILAQTPTSLKTPNELVDYWIERVLGREMHPAENRQSLVDFMAQGRNPDFDLTADQISERTPRMVALLLMSPDFQLR